MSYKETELGKIPEDWDIVTIEEALDKIIDYRGKTPKKSDTGVLTLSAKSVKNGYIEYSNAYFISEKTYEEFMVRGKPKAGDILLTTEAPLGYVATLDREDVGLAQRLLTLRGKKNYLHNNYLRYYLMSPTGQHQLKARESGTTVTGIKQSEFRKALITIPSYKEQKVIADILSNLDNRIETNNKITERLKEIAQALFNHWFIDYEFPNENGNPYNSSGGEMVKSELGMIPKGWKVDNVLNNIKEVSIKNKDELDIPVLSVVKEGKFVLSDNYFNKQVYSKSTKNYKIITKDCLGYNPSRANIGSIAVLREFEQGLLSPIYKVFEFNGSITPEYFIQYMKKTEFKELIVKHSSGTTRQNFDYKGFSQFMIAIPENHLQRKFSDIYIQIEEVINHKIKENKIIAQLRDLLLPKLISGEIRVPIDNEVLSEH